MTSCTCKLEVNEAGSLTCEVPRTHPLFGTFEPMSPDHEVRLYEDGEELFRGRIRKVEESDDSATEKLTCEGQLAYLGDSTLMPYGTYADPDGKWRQIAAHDLRSILSWYVGEHNAQANASQRFRFRRDEVPDDHADRASSDAVATLDEIKDKVLARGYCLVAATEGADRVLDVTTSGYQEAQQTVEFGSNLLSLDVTMEPDDLYTAVIPYAKVKRQVTEGKTTREETVTIDVSSVDDGDFGDGCAVSGDMVVDAEGARAHGVISCRREFDAQTPTTLAGKAAAWLRSSRDLVTSMTVTAVDLHKVDRSVRPIRLGEWVRVRSRPLGIDQSLMCVQMEIDPLDPSGCKYQLGGTRRTLTRRQSLRVREVRNRLGDGIQAAQALSAEAKASAVSAEEAGASAMAEVRDLVTLRIDSSRGTVFKNSEISTVLTVRCYKRGEEIVTRDALRAAMGDQTARIRWWVLREGDSSWVSLDDGSGLLSDDGFTCTVTPDDVEVKCTFKAEVLTG